MYLLTRNKDVIKDDISTCKRDTFLSHAKFHRNQNRRDEKNAVVLLQGLVTVKVEAAEVEVEAEAEAEAEAAVTGGIDEGKLTQTAFVENNNESMRNNAVTRADPGTHCVGVAARPIHCPPLFNVFTAATRTCAFERARACVCACDVSSRQREPLVVIWKRQRR